MSDVTEALFTVGAIVALSVFAIVILIIIAVIVFFIGRWWVQRAIKIPGISKRQANLAGIAAAGLFLLFGIWGLIIFLVLTVVYKYWGRG
jgi:hypothetical protein